MSVIPSGSFSLIDSLVFLTLLALNINGAGVALAAQLPPGATVVEPAVRVVRFNVDYPKADLGQIPKLTNWPTIMRKSVLASLKFVNKHWAICGEEKTSEK
jgi:hypothetical protein